MGKVFHKKYINAPAHRIYTVTPRGYLSSFEIFSALLGFRILR